MYLRPYFGVYTILRRIQRLIRIREEIETKIQLIYFFKFFVN